MWKGGVGVSQPLTKFKHVAWAEARLVLFVLWFSVSVIE